MQGLERDELVMTLVESALEQLPSNREEHLRNACGSDPTLFQEVWSRVQWEERMGGFLLEPLIGRTNLDHPSALEATVPLLARQEGLTGRTNLDHPFAPGELISERFRIVRKVAEGGMAVVYEAIDQKLEQRIAIKCPKAGFGRRVPPEVRSALQVTHINVCRTYEIHAARTPHADLDFLTMEFLEGETLSERIQRDGPLEETSAREVALQVCAGLEEAHRKNVIHRDLKSNNVILTQTVNGELRAVITDFGLARQTSPGPSCEAASPPAVAKTSQLYGTPDYMAPELWKGGQASVASDIYALGVILYEIATGRRPFADDVPWDARLSQLPEAPSLMVAGVPAAWDRAILRCLEPESSKRFQSAAEVSQALGGKAHRLWPAVVSILCFALAVVAGVGHQINKSRAPHPVRLAVLEFASDPGVEALGKGVLHDVSERLLRLQSRQSGLVVIPESEATRYNVRTPQGARSVLGATHALQGAFRMHDKKLLATASVTDAQLQVKLRDFAEEYEVTDLGSLSKALTGTVTAALRMTNVTVPETVSAAAYPYYTQGIYYLQKDLEGDDSATAWFEKASQLDPNAALPYAGLAEAELQKFSWTRNQSWLDQAQDSVRKAEHRNPDSARVHIVAGMVQQSVGSYEKAVEDFRRAIQLEPKNPDALRRLAAAYAAMNQTADAVAAYQQAIEAQPDYFRPYDDLGVFYYARADYEDAATQFRTVIRLAPGLDYGHANLGKVYSEQGRYKEAETEFRTALGMRETQDMVHTLAVLLANERRDTEAVPLYERALAMGPETFLLLMNLGEAYRRMGRSADALKAYRRGLKLALNELLRNPRDGYVRAYVAYLYARLGDTNRAEVEITQALRFSPEDAKVRRRAVVVYEVLGRREDALGVVQAADPNLLGELSRHPDLADLQRDPRFLRMLAAASPH